jgi:hypothetical protein
MTKCYKCGTPYQQGDPVSFSAVCEGCQSYVHCCMNCRFYDEGAHNHCKEPQAEYVSDTHGRNTCEYFSFKRPASALVDDPDDPEARRQRRRPDWRNVRGRENGGRRGPRRPSPFGDNGNGNRPRARNPFGDDTEPRRAARNPFGDGSGNGGDRAKKAREALDKLFKKPEE